MKSNGELPFSTTHRRRRSTRKSRQIDPLTVDASQFDFEQAFTSTATINQKQPSRTTTPMDAISVHSVDDLIDLNDDEPVASSSSSTFAPKSLTNNVHSSPNLQQNEFLATLNPQKSTFLASSQHMPSTNGSSPNNSSVVNLLRSKWEKFD